MRARLLRAGNCVKTTEDFITAVASKSYLTGATYLVKTPDGKSLPTAAWLNEELARLRVRAN
jgi:hypothetical protein